MPWDESPIDGICAIEGAFVFGIDEDSAQNRLDVSQCSSRKVLLLGDRTQHSISIHRAKLSQAKVPDVIAKIIPPDFVMVLAGAGSTFLLGPG
jgi:hypothetical protein